jgi:hypothetical protein
VQSQSACLAYCGYDNRRQRGRGSARCYFSEAGMDAMTSTAASLGPQADDVTVMDLRVS